MIRPGMTGLIQQLKDFTATQTDITRWSDDVLQNQLDRVVMEHRGVSLLPLYSPLPGTTNYINYSLPDYFGKWVEAPDPGIVDSKFKLYDGANNPVFNYTYDQYLNQITFDANTNGKIYYLYARSYNMYRGAANVWLEKSSDAAKLTHVKIDNHDLHLDQKFDHCMLMHKYYSGKAGNFITLYRADQHAYTTGRTRKLS